MHQTASRRISTSQAIQRNVGIHTNNDNREQRAKFRRTEALWNILKRHGVTLSNVGNGQIADKEKRERALWNCIKRSGVIQKCHMMHTQSNGTMQFCIIRNQSLVYRGNTRWSIVSLSGVCKTKTTWNYNKSRQRTMDPQSNIENNQATYRNIRGIRNAYNPDNLQWW